MTNHIHLIFSSSFGNPSGLLRDYKKFTAKKIIKAISINPQESRKNYLVSRFIRHKATSKSRIINQLWQHHNHPIELPSVELLKQKLDYLLANPVKAGFVTESWHWKWSSARNMAGMEGVIEIDEIGYLF